MLIVCSSIFSITWRPALRLVAARRLLEKVSEIDCLHCNFTSGSEGRGERTGDDDESRLRGGLESAYANRLHRLRARVCLLCASAFNMNFNEFHTSYPSIVADLFFRLRNVWVVPTPNAKRRLSEKEHLCKYFNFLLNIIVEAMRHRTPQRLKRQSCAAERREFR